MIEKNLIVSAEKNTNHYKEKLLSYMNINMESLFEEARNTRNTLYGNKLFVRASVGFSRNLASKPRNH